MLLGIKMVLRQGLWKNLEYGIFKNNVRNKVLLFSLNSGGFGGMMVRNVAKKENGALLGGRLYRDYPKLNALNKIFL